MNKLVTQESANTLACAQVMALVFRDNIKVPDACRQVGISPRQYYYWLETRPESMEEIRHFIGEQERRIIFAIASVRHKVVDKLLEAIEDPLTSGVDKMKMYQYLEETLEKLQAEHHAKPGIEEEAAAFLKRGPTLTKQISRFSSVDVSRTQDGLTVNINVQPPSIIDLTSSSPESPQENTLD